MIKYVEETGIVYYKPNKESGFKRGTWTIGSDSGKVKENEEKSSRYQCFFAFTNICRIILKNLKSKFTLLPKIEMSAILLLFHR